MKSIHDAAPDLYAACKAAESVMLETSVHFDFGLIPLLRALQSEHPDFATESVEQCLYTLERGSDERDELESALRQTVAALDKALPTRRDISRAATMAVLREYDMKRTPPPSDGAGGPTNHEEDRG